MNKSFSEAGFLIVRNAISKKLISKIQTEIYNFLNKTDKRSVTHKESYENFCIKTNSLKQSEYEFTKPLYEYLFYKEYFDRIFLEKKLFNSLSSMLGKDLSYDYDPSLVLNLPNKNSSKKNYMFKDWHQEIWSGSSISSVLIWMPIFQKNNKQGQVELISESHKWGHIPHRNRQPIELPKKYKTTTLNLRYGDVIIFSTLLLHRSLKADYPRLALPFAVKNFKYKDNSFEENRNWKKFSYSELTKVERILGNHYLSPYRIIDLNSDINSGTIKKKK